MLKEFTFQIVNKIEVGAFSGRKIGRIAEDLGFRKVLLVVDYNLRKKGLIEHIFNSLMEEGVNFEIFDGIKSEPTIDEVDQAIKVLGVASNFDGVIGIGGGSTIDVAKLLAVSKSIKGSIKNYIGIDLIKEPGVPAIMLPTTAGTGAETTPNAIVKNPIEGWKKGIVSSYLIPKMVILDPELTVSLPSKITAETGIDAFTHAIECFIGNKSNMMSDLFALEAIRLIATNLHQAVREGNDRVARYNMLLASFYGGVAITNSGTGGVHALSYPLGAKFNLSHGLSNSVLLAEVMRFNAKAVPEKFVKVGEMMGIKSDMFSREEIVELTVNEIDALAKGAGICFEEFTISEEILEDLAKLAMAEQRLLENNPRPITQEDAREIYRRALLLENR